MYEIESNIPVPSATRRGRGSAYPFATMSVNDSFFIGTKDEAEDQRAVNRVTAAARIFRKSNPQFAGLRVLARPVTEGDKVGVRVWRVA
jgi:hypothetical protein